VIPATPEQQRRLLALQEVDTARRKLEHRRAHLPEQKALDDNADILQRIAAEYASSRERLVRLETQQRRHEGEIAAVEARRRSEEGRMYSGLIRSEKELEALRHELGSLRGRKSDLEDALLEVMQSIEDLESMVATLGERHGELTGMVATLATARDAAAADIDAELLDRRRERASVAAELPPALLAAYDDLRARKDGVGAAALRGRACMGCRLELPTVELEDLRAAAESGVATCPQCGRIVVPV
jgi:uncharacterized protein